MGAAGLMREGCCWRLSRMMRRSGFAGIFGWGRNIRAAPGFIHGGIIATVLDEVMGKVCRFRGVRAVTAELSIEYLKPVLVDADLVVEGYEVEMQGRNLFLAGEIRDVSGKVLARGKGRFVIIDLRSKPRRPMRRKN